MNCEQDHIERNVPDTIGTLTVQQYTDLINSYTSTIDPRSGDLTSTCPSIKVISLRIEDTKDPDPLLYFQIDSDVSDVRKTTLGLHLTTLQNLWRALKVIYHKSIMGVPMLPPEISSKPYLGSRFMRGIVIYIAALLRRLLSHSMIKHHELVRDLFTKHERESTALLQKLVNPDLMHGHSPSDNIIHSILSQAHGHLHGNLHGAGLAAALNLPLMYNLTLADAAYLRTGHYGHNLMKLVVDHTITKSMLATFRAKLKINAAYLESVDQTTDIPKKELLNEFLYAPISLKDFYTMNFAKTVRGVLLKRHLVFEENLKSAHDSIKQLSSAVAGIIDAESGISRSIATLADSLTCLFVSETKFSGVLAGPATNAVAACVNPPSQSDFLHSQIANQLRADVYPRIATSLDIVSFMAKLTLMRYDYLVISEFLAQILKKKASDMVYLKIQQEILGEVATINKKAVKKQLDILDEAKMNRISYGTYADTKEEAYINIAYENNRAEIGDMFKAIDDETTAAFNEVCVKHSLSKTQVELLDSFRHVHAAFIEHIVYLTIMEGRFIYEYLFCRCMVTEMIVHSMGRLSAIFGRTIHVESNLWESSDEWIRTTRGKKTPWYYINDLGGERYELDVDLSKDQIQQD